MVLHLEPIPLLSPLTPFTGFRKIEPLLKLLALCHPVFWKVWLYFWTCFPEIFVPIQDSDTSGLDAEIARIELQDARKRINHLEEALLGKQTALEQIQNEYSTYKEQQEQQGQNGQGNDQVLKVWFNTGLYLKTAHWVKSRR